MTLASWTSLYRARAVSFGGRLLRPFTQIPPGSRLKVALGFAAALALFVASRHALSTVVVNTTDSVPHHLFLLDRGSEIAPGDYVLAPLHHELLPPGYDRLSKILLCAEGQHLEIRDRVTYCDGVRLHEARTETRSGYPLEAFEWSGAVPAGKAYIGSPNEFSFDSRYLGFFDVADLQRLEPVL